MEQISESEQEQRKTESSWIDPEHGALHDDFWVSKTTAKQPRMKSFAFASVVPL